MLTDETADAVARLTAAGVDASDDPAWCETHRPCVLVAPPVVDFTTRAVNHRIIALAGTDVAGVDSFAQLSRLVDEIADALPVERAEPITYPLTSNAGTVPAYLCTVTGTVT